MAEGEGDGGRPEQAKVTLRYQFAGAEGTDKIVLECANDFSVSFICSSTREEKHDTHADGDEDNLRYGFAHRRAALHLRHQVAHCNVNETR